MEDIPSVSSEEELVALRDQGKISEAEYEELLGAMRRSASDQYRPPAGTPAKAPTSLKIVAVLFIIGGVLAVIEILAALARGGININFGVLGLFIGPGLLRFSRGWRTCGLVFLWIGLVGLPIIFLIGLTGSVPAHFTVFGIKMARIPSWWVSVGVIPFFVLVLWQYRVLTRPDVRRHFGLT